MSLVFAVFADMASPPAEFWWNFLFRSGFLFALSLVICLIFPRPDGEGIVRQNEGDASNRGLPGSVLIVVSIGFALIATSSSLVSIAVGSLAITVHAGITSHIARQAPHCSQQGGGIGRNY